MIQPYFPEAGPCEQGCTNMASVVVVTVNGWLIDVCEDCARYLCDPIGAPAHTA